MEKRKWYLRTHVVLTAFVSLTAVMMSALLLLLLPQISEIISVMQWRMVTAETFRVEADVEYRGWKSLEDDLGRVSRTQERVMLSTDGAVDRRIGGEGERQAHDVRLEVGAEGASFSPVHVFDGQLRRIGEANFVRLYRVPARFGTFRLDRFVDRWLRVDPAPLLRQLDLPLVGGGAELSDDDMAFLAEQFRATPFLTVQNRLRNEDLDGAQTFHYEIRPEVLFLKDFYVIAEEMRLGRDLTDRERRRTDRFFANVQPETGEMWIGRSDYYLYRLRLRFRYDDGIRDGVLSVDLRFRDFNAPVTVSGPDEEVQNLRDIVASLLPSIVNSLPMAALGDQNTVSDDGRREGGLPVDVIDEEDSDSDPDGDGLSTALEHFYGTDPHNPDTDGDGATDGDEVMAGTNPTGSGGLFDFGITSHLDRNAADETDEVEASEGADDASSPDDSAPEEDVGTSTD